MSVAPTTIVNTTSWPTPAKKEANPNVLAKYNVQTSRCYPPLPVPRELCRPMVPMQLSALAPCIIPKSGIDAHFHPENLLKQSGLSSLEEAINICSKGFPYHLECCFPCYAFPKKWPNIADLATLPAPANKVALGWHPTCASLYFDQQDKSKYREGFNTLVKAEQVKVVGEVGLDLFRETSREVQQQQICLLQQMCWHAVQNHLPILIHCRDLPRGTEAMETCRQIMREIVDQDWPVYLHCYNYDLCKWLKAFLKCFVGITPKVLGADCHPQLINVVKVLDPDRLLLETDAPYFNPSTLGGQFPHGAPCRVFYLAHRVAEWHGCSADTVLLDAAHATYAFYRM